MKIKTFISAVFVAGAMLCSYASVPKVPDGEYMIEGELRNVPDSVVIDLLQEVEGGRFVLLPRTLSCKAGSPFVTPSARPVRRNCFCSLSAKVSRGQGRMSGYSLESM